MVDVKVKNIPMNEDDAEVRIIVSIERVRRDGKAIIEVAGPVTDR